MKLAGLFVRSVLALGLSGCSSLTTGQRQGLATAVGVGTTIVQTVADLAVQKVLARALSDSDLTAKADKLDSAALFMRTLEKKSGGIVTVTDIIGGVRAATDPSKAHWGTLAEQLATQVLNSSLPPDVALEQSAIGLNQAAATARQQQALP